MTAILYPVAVDAGQAFAAPKGRAARERDAVAVAGEQVAFVTELMGPLYATREAALDALAGRVEDDRPGRAASLPPEDRVVQLVEQVAPKAGKRSHAPAPVKPTFEDGRRWPAPAPPPATVWRAMISYWRIGAAPMRHAGDAQARQARRKGGEDIDRDTLRALTRQPLLAVKPQQPLDIGLFETRLPEAPHIVVPDE
ncbi:hypothetical protein GGQ61_001512 [Phenylobacterium haematophilum]|uniref:Uncharacterized protein n=1 Tax=Phenylobacterium haematophilum TaxID=98513 RepID=A0A839ZWA2_9CAUL|nr:hypothetical protein [Phenylobacterium haematophilum]MBB3890795.1 hypothetical protein [Phenylobacterium haematophilum]